MENSKPHNINTKGQGGREAFWYLRSSLENKKAIETRSTEHPLGMTHKRIVRANAMV